MTYVIALPCVDIKDRACVEECPVDCIYEGGRSLYIHPDECVDCGKCMPACPNDAIFWEYKTPPEQAPFIEANALFVRSHGLSGGGEDADPIDEDHPLVAQRRPR